MISQVVSAIDKVSVDTEKNLLDILDRVHEIRVEAVDQTHLFMLSQAYEGLLLKMGEKNNDGGQFFTPREVIRAMVRIVDPRVGETVYDPGCGTGGFLAQAFEHMRPAWATPRPPSSCAPCARRRSGAARRPTSSTRSRSRTWSSTGSTSRTSGTATRSRARRSTAGCSPARPTSSTSC